MAISKIIKVNDLFATIRYVTQDKKTSFGGLISTFKCNVPFVAHQFNRTTQNRRKLSNHSFSVESWMIFQSFMYEEITPDKAHELGNELAKRYLGNDHQYIVTTHIDSGYVHNHIVFCATNFNNHKSFDSRTKHIITDLRKTNDEICYENNLSVIENPKGRGISQREFYARKNNRSYKAELERIIDNAIANSESYQDFLEIMDRNVEADFSKMHITFKLPGQKRSTRLTSLGVDYYENSIKYRIENKHDTIVKIPEIKTLIDTSQPKFQGKEKAGLRRWAIRENINTLSDISHAIHKEGITSQEYQKRQESALSRISELGKKIENLDKQIASHEKYLKHEKFYRESIPLIQGYKKSKNKDQYKRKYFAEFKEYDKAKSYLNIYKNEDGTIPKPDRIKAETEDLKTERDLLYTEYQSVKQQLVQPSQSQLSQEKDLDYPSKKLSREDIEL